MREHLILLVDDDPGILIGIGKSLKAKGYNVSTANSGEKAIAMLQEHTFDLVITDLVMEGIGGLDVLKKAKEVDPEIMAIVLTGYGSLDSSIEALRCNADDYILKPCEPDELEFRVAGCLDRLACKRKVKLYEDILPVCCMCGRIRDDTGVEHGCGHWVSVEKYLWKRAGIAPSSTYCPECLKKVQEDMG